MIITVVGAGGKTTVCERLGAELAQRGYSALFTTTTHIRRPSGMPVYIGDMSDINPIGELMAAACGETKEGKLKGYTPADIDAIKERQLFDMILVEGDGAKERPVKAPADWEPVYPAQTAIVIGVIGLDCLGKPVTDEFVHRPELFCKITGANPGDPIACGHLLALIKNKQGLFRSAPAQAKKIVFLNKEDLLGIHRRKVLELIRQTDVPVLLTSHDNNWPDEFISGYIPGRKEI